MLKRWSVLALAAMLFAAGQAWAVDVSDDLNDQAVSSVTVTDDSSTYTKDIVIAHEKDVVVGGFSATGDSSLTGTTGADFTLGHRDATLEIYADDFDATFNTGAGNFTLNAGTFRIGSYNAKAAKAIIGGNAAFNGGRIYLEGDVPDSATLSVIGHASIAGGTFSLDQNASFTARTFDIFGSADIVVEDTSVLKSTLNNAADPSAYSIVIRDGGRVDLGSETASITVGAAGNAGVKIGRDGFVTTDVEDFSVSNGASLADDSQSFWLEEGGVLGMLGSDFTVNQGTAVLDGVLMFSGDADKDNNAALEFGGDYTSAFISTGADITIGSTAKVVIESTLAQLIADNAVLSNITGDSAAESILLVDGGTADVADYSAFLNADGSAQVLSALGQYTLQTGEAAFGGGGSAKNIYITGVEREVNFRDGADIAQNAQNFQANMADLYGSNIASSGFASNVFDAALYTIFDSHFGFSGDAAQMAPEYLARLQAFQDNVVPSGAFMFNMYFATASLHGYGTPFMSYLVVDADNDMAGLIRQTFTVSPGLVEQAVGATVDKTNEVNQNVGRSAMRMIGRDRLHRVRGQFEVVQNALGVSAGDALASAMLNGDCQNRVWAGAFGMWEDADRRDNFAGYEYDSYGVMVGYDRVFGPLVLGGAFGYQTGDYEDKAMDSNDSDIDNYSFNLYAAWFHHSGLFGSLIGGYTRSDNDLDYTSGGARYSEDYHADTWYVEGKIGYDFRPTANFRLSPSVGIGYIDTRSKAHSAHNKSILDDTIHFGRQKANTGYIPVELDAAYDVCVANGDVLTLSANGGYTYNFDDDAAAGNMRLADMGTPAYASLGRSRGHGMWNIGAGVKYASSRWEIGAKYDYYGKSDADAHSVQAFVGFKF